MFVVDCPELETQVLVFDRQIEARVPTRHGTVVQFRCSCGATGARLNDPGAVSGRLVVHRAAAAAA